MITALPRDEWFFWRNAPISWTQSVAAIPGFMPISGNSQFLQVKFHISHIPFLPTRERAEVELLCKRKPLYTAWNLDHLRQYQRADYANLHWRKGALLCYMMRLGKTPLATSLHDPREGIFLATGPLSSREAWRIWTERTFGAPCFCLTGTKGLDDYGTYDSYFAHYEILGAHTRALSKKRIGTFVLDEAHILQGEGTKRSTAINIMAPQAYRRFLLTGTPMWNRPRSLYSLLHLTMPGAWGTRFEFQQRYCNPQPTAYGWQYDGESNVEELRLRLDRVMVQRNWDKVAPELPSTIHSFEPIGLTGRQFAEIEAAATKATLLHGNTAGMQGKYLATLRQKLAALKIPAVATCARQAIQDGHTRVVVWTWHNEIGKKYQDAFEGLNIFRLCSEDSPEKRDFIVERFRESENAILIASMGVGGAGLDLSCSDYAIFAELDFTPAMVQQAEMRTFHISRPHVVVFFYVDCPIETKLISTLDVKNGYAASLGLTATDIFREVLQ